MTLNHIELCQIPWPLQNFKIREEKRTQTEAFRSRYLWVGWGSSTSRGGFQKVRYVLRNPGKPNFLARYPGILPGYPGGAREVWERKVRVQSLRNFETLHSRELRVADWNVSSVVLESGDASGAFLQPQYWINFLDPWMQDFYPVLGWGWAPVYQKLSGDPIASMFSKVLPYKWEAKWEAFCHTNGRRTAVQMGGVLLRFPFFKA